MDKHLHIICFDVPYPADYGGVIDVYYRIRSLHEIGVKIYLHCFTKNRAPQPMLEKYCVEINYYPRKTNLSGFSRNVPYIVHSRNSAELLQRLLKDNHPVLAEGVHCTSFLQDLDAQHRKIFIRLHNVEYSYYEQLAKHERHIFKKIYFLHEAKLLKKYEAAIANKAHLLTLSTDDRDVYQTLFHAKQVQFLPVSLPWNVPESKDGTGTYCLYHGNLSVNENERAAMWLVNEVFRDTNIKLIIAGHNPSEKLKKCSRANKNIELIADPGEVTMQQLVENAQINVLPSFNNTGVKLKLLNALFNGRHCLVNAAATAGSGLEHLCETVETAEEFRDKIHTLFNLPVTEKEMQHRSAALKELYNNEHNAALLSAWL